MTTMPFGRFRGWPLRDLPDNYLAWLLTLDNLREPLRSSITDERTRRATRARVDPAVAEDVIAAGRRALARKRHPDIGGTHEAMVALDVATDWLFAQVAELRGTEAAA